MSDIVKTLTDKRVRDAMNAPAVTVTPEDSARHAAELMIKLRVSGLPVVDAKGRPLGVVSETDFRFADAIERQKQRETWIKILSGGQDMAKDYLDALEREADQVKRIMATPAICVDEEAGLVEAAELMSQRRIRRLVVVRDGKVSGVVTRSGLLRFFAPQTKTARPVPTPAEFDQAMEAAGLPAPKSSPEPAPAPPPEGVVSASALKKLVGDFERRKSDMKTEAQRQAQDRRNEAVKELLRAKYSEAELRQLMTLAHEAARRGEASCVALTFPAALCADGGRTINLPSPEWPASLRGKAADFFLLWERELKPQGFGLSARIATFPDGFPGDAELSLVWGREG